MTADDVVDSIIEACLAERQRFQGLRYERPHAIAVTKAELEAIKKRFMDNGPGHIDVMCFDVPLQVVDVP